MSRKRCKHAAANAAQDIILDAIRWHKDGHGDTSSSLASPKINVDHYNLVTTNPNPVVNTQGLENHPPRTLLSGRSLYKSGLRLREPEALLLDSQIEYQCRSNNFTICLFCYSNLTFGDIGSAPGFELSAIPWRYFVSSAIQFRAIGSMPFSRHSSSITTTTEMGVLVEIPASPIPFLPLMSSAQTMFFCRSESDICKRLQDVSPRHAVGASGVFLVSSSSSDYSHNQSPFGLHHLTPPGSL